MNTFELQILGNDIYQIIIRNSDDTIIDVIQRQDYRDEQIAKIALFSFVNIKWLSFDNSELDRFLFL